jgi:hypothetical protein
MLNFEKCSLRSTMAISLSLCLALSVASASYGKDKSKNKQTANVFSAPPEMNEIPMYVKNDGTPLTPRAADNVDNGDLDLVSKLPSLTNDQRKAVNKIIQDGRNEMNAMRASVQKLQNELKAAQPTKSGKITGVKQHSIAAANPAASENSPDMMQEQAIDEPTPQELKALIQTGNDRIKDKNVAVWQAVVSKLTMDQKGDLDKMKQGRLIINTSASLPADQALDTTYGEVKDDNGLNKTLVKRAMTTVKKTSLYESVIGNRAKSN